MMPNSLYITAKQLADRFSVSVRTIHRWSGGLDGFPRPRKINNRNYWSVAEMERWEIGDYELYKHAWTRSENSRRRERPNSKGL